MSDSSSGSGDLKRKSLDPEAPHNETVSGDATKKSKLSFSVGLKKPTAGPAGEKNNVSAFASSKIKPRAKIQVAPISMKLAAVKSKEPEKIVKPSRTVAKAFAEESDEEEEDMPPEAKMRMKNIGRNTPTSAGPNSFNKGRLGFSSPSAKWKTQGLKSEAEKVPAPPQDKDGVS